MKEDLATRIMRHEGFDSVPRYDAKGMYVVGIGHDITAGEAAEYAEPMSRHEAESLLDSDLAKCEIEVNRAFPWVAKLSRLRQDVLVEMAFQQGIFALHAYHDMLAAFKSGDYATAAREMLRSEWYHETPGRCRELSELMRTGNQDEVLPWTKPPA